MADILTVGSINIDHVFHVDHFVRPGETIDSPHYQIFGGGKGFNPAIAVARAGGSPRHVGAVGKDGLSMVERLKTEGVDTEFIEVLDTPTGQAIIQVVPSGENAIILQRGANHELKSAVIKQAIETCSPGDYLVLPNETNAVAETIAMGHEAGLRVVFNPAPMTAAVHDYPLDLVSILIINETEAEAISGKSAPQDIVTEMRKRFPNSATVLTLGAKGALYFDAHSEYQQPAEAVEAVDTTAAGDTFIGYLVFELSQGSDPQTALSVGCRAATVSVTKQGASDSIPHRREIENA